MDLTYYIDCERMKYPNTGLYKFCEHLGWSLIKEKSTNENLIFYTSSKELNFFGNNVKYLKQSNLHKLFFPKIPMNALWHATFQETEYFPYKIKNPLVLTIHDINFMHTGEKSLFKRKYLINQLTKKIRRANHVVFISEFVKKNVQEYIDLEVKHHSVIYNGCNISHDLSITKPNIKPKQEFLFTVSSITPKKNIHVLPALLINNNYDLIIAGNSHDKKYVELILQEARKFKVENRLIFTGPISESDKKWYLKNCKAFLFPSLSEGFGMPVVEAMAFGKPLFLSNRTSLPEIGGDMAFYFNSFESKELQEVFETGIKKYDTLNLSDSIKTRASKFEWSNTAKEYLNIYRSFL